MGLEITLLLLLLFRSLSFGLGRLARAFILGLRLIPNPSLIVICCLSLFDRLPLSRRRLSVFCFGCALIRLALIATRAGAGAGAGAGAAATTTAGCVGYF